MDDMSPPVTLAVSPWDQWEPPQVDLPDPTVEVPPLNIYPTPKWPIREELE